MLFSNVEAEPIAGVLAKRSSLKIDGSPGHSGGPVYWCPGGADPHWCEQGDVGYVIGVFAGYNSATDRHIAPKVPAFRDAALAFIND